MYVTLRVEKQNHPKYLKSRDRATGGKSKGQTRDVEASGINVKKPRQQQRQSASWEPRHRAFWIHVGPHRDTVLVRGGPAKQGGNVEETA